ncbi:MAG: FAD-dependent pyridine nucleotide-disulfide oxidoreductase, partial [Ramlibacter sp.]|nr:FAD-dependent pyridine nucleotide-disulfide oxidoreductase [Ramlibacter sp.]
ATSDPAVFALGDCAQYAPGRWTDGPLAGGRTLPYVLPIMSAARVLAAQLAGRCGTLAFPLMPVSIKTPALPLVVASPALDSTGQWHGPEEGLWHFIDGAGLHRGFVLSGKQTSRRAELVQRLAV